MNADSLSIDELRAIDKIALEFECECREGREPSIAEFASRFPQQRSKLAVELIHSRLEIDYRGDRCRPISAYLADCPSDVDRHTLRNELEQLAGSFVSRYPKSGESLPKDFGRYQLLERLGAGASGTVYRAFDRELQRDIALKQLSRNPDDFGDFRREARALARIDHPNVCPVIDVGEHDGAAYFTMPVAKGTPLSESISDGTLSEDDALRITRSLASALAATHASGVLHRDIKPHNILLCDSGTPVLIDFGLCRDGSQSVSLSDRYEAIGTPAYMAPEVIRGRSDEIGSRTDVYSLGVVFFEMLSGSLPYRGSTREVVTQIESTRPAPSVRERAPSVRATTAELCSSMMQKDAASRVELMTSVIEEIDEILAGTSATRTRRRDSSQLKTILVALAAVVALVSGWSVLATQDSRAEVAQAAVSTPSFDDRTVFTNSIGIEFAAIPAGSFEMGERGDDKSSPAHPVTISKPFLMGRTEVTAAQFRKFVEATDYVTDVGRGVSAWQHDPVKATTRYNDAISWRAPGYEPSLDYPVTCVTFRDAIEFCSWLSETEQRTYRLPTEAEWEYACRAGTATLYSQGDIVTGADANFYSLDPVGTTRKVKPVGRPENVARYPANQFGLFDMHGNVFEYCSDWYGPYSAEPQIDPIGPSTGEMKVIRGGGWHYSGYHLRSAFRFHDFPNSAANFQGFRVVLEKEQSH